VGDAEIDEDGGRLVVDAEEVEVAIVAHERGSSDEIAAIEYNALTLALSRSAGEGTSMIRFPDPVLFVLMRKRWCFVTRDTKECCGGFSHRRKVHLG
jgi:hypothetical protein